MARSAHDSPPFLYGIHNFAFASIYQDYCSNPGGSVSGSYFFFLYHCCKIVLSMDLKDVKGYIAHAKKSWVKQKTAATSNDPKW